MLHDQRILETISTRGAGLEVVCEALVAQTNAQGGRGNISAVLVDTTLSA
jgi:serine/threonine protein phosphatase PrpC